MIEPWAKTCASRVTPSFRFSCTRNRLRAPGAQIADATGMDPVEVYIERLIESEGRELWNYWGFGGALENQWAYMQMEHCIPMLGDSGAHVATWASLRMRIHLPSCWLNSLGVRVYTALKKRCIASLKPLQM